MIEYYSRLKKPKNSKPTTKKYFSFLMLLLGFSIQAQWVAVGNSSGISDGGTGHIQLRNDATGNYYAAYYDISVSKGSVQKYDGSAWSYLGGSAGITDSYALYSRLAVKDAENIYYSHQGNGMEVQKFDGSYWASLESPITSTVNYQSLEVGTDGILYAGSTTDQGTIKRYVNNAWEQVGTSGFASGVASYIDIVLGTNGKIYVSFNNNGYVHVYENNANASSEQEWTAVGGEANLAAASSSENYNSSMAIDASNHLYLSYVSGGASGNKLNVKKFNGTSWIQLGAENFSPGRTQHNSLAVSPAGTPYVAASNWEGGLSDSSYLRNYVMKYDSVTDSWLQVYTDTATDSPYVSSGPATYNSLLIDNYGDLVLAYNDGSLDKLVVQKFDIAEAIPYCTIAFLSGAEPISNVTFAGIANDSSPVIAAGLPDYEDFTSLTAAQVNQEATYTIAVSAYNPANTIGNFANHILAYFDWNHNGSFADSGEGYYLGYVQGNAVVATITGNITVPSDALLGNTTMRIVKKYYTTTNQSIPSPCNSTGYGQAEDYTVFVSLAGAVAVESLTIATQGNITAEITTAGGTLQLTTTVLPAESSQNVNWTIVSGTAATVNSNGLVTASENGTIIIKAISATNSSVFSTIEVTITNQDIEPINTAIVITSGFNYDIIANGIGDASLSSDLGFDEHNSRALVSKDFQATENDSTPTYGLPVNGTIESVNTAGVTFQLANYTGPNALFLTPSYVSESINTQNTGTLTFAAVNVEKIYILSGAAGGGSGNLSYTAAINFTDGTIATATLSCSDWYDGTGFAIKGIGRVNRANNNLEGNSNNPRLYENVIELDPADQSKTISGIDFSFEGDDTAEYSNEIRLSILAITTTGLPMVTPPASACVFTTLDLTGFNADVVAEGTGGNTDNKTTTVIDAANVYYAEDFVPLNPHSSGASAAAFGGGLPNNGTLTSLATAGLGYQIADYTAPNALVLRNSLTNTGTLTLTTPKKAEKVYLAAVSAEGLNTVTVTINFTDATSQTFTIQATDWYQSNAPSNVITNSIGRVSRGASWAPLNKFGELAQTGLYQNELTIDASNYGKNITSISFEKETSSNNATTTTIMAISICESQALGTGEIVKNSIVRLYPNPTSDYITIDSEEEVKEVKIYNITGQQIWKGKGTEKQINLSAAEQGLYLVHIEFENGKTALHKIVKK